MSAPTKAALRRDPAAAARYARDRLEAGATREDILDAIWGVPFPAEFHAIADKGWRAIDLPLERTSLPWNLITPLADGGPRLDDPFASDAEVRAVEAMDDFVPLCTLLEDDAVHGGLLVGYDRARLAEGDSTVLGFEEDFEVDATPERLGPSLVAVLREWTRDQLRMWRQRVDDGGHFGAADARDIAAAEALVDIVDALAAAAAAR